MQWNLEFVDVYLEYYSVLLCALENYVFKSIEIAKLERVFLLSYVSPLYSIRQKKVRFPRSILVRYSPDDERLSDHSYMIRC